MIVCGGRGVGVCVSIDMFSFLLKKKKIKVSLILSKPPIRMHHSQKVVSEWPSKHPWPLGTHGFLLHCVFNFLWLSTCSLFSFSFLRTDLVLKFRDAFQAALGKKKKTPLWGASHWTTETSPMLANLTGCLISFFHIINSKRENCAYKLHPPEFKLIF